MAKYRKKPVIVDAELYQPGMEDGFTCDQGDCIGYGKWNDDHFCDYAKPYINTLEGKHYISPGDYIVTGVENERYPVKPSIFKKTYEKVED